MQLKSISSIDFDGFAAGQEGDSDSVQLGYALSSLATRQVCKRMTYQPSSAKLFDLALPDLHSCPDHNWLPGKEGAPFGSYMS